MSEFRRPDQHAIQAAWALLSKALSRSAPQPQCQRQPVGMAGPGRAERCLITQLSCCRVIWRIVEVRAHDGHSTQRDDVNVVRERNAVELSVSTRTRHIRQGSWLFGVQRCGGSEQHVGRRGGSVDEDPSTHMHQHFGNQPQKSYRFEIIAISM